MDDHQDIDFVIPWVDGSDPAWLAEKQRYSGTIVDDSNSANRYRDWGLLPYWFRGVEKFAPWVHRIFFVTWGHLPAFLNVNHPKLRIVRHEDYIPKEYLPTFSANPIELNIHRIHGLSEKFVYFNDDMFLLRPLPMTSFFQDGRPCIYGSESPICPSSTEVWEHLLLNDVSIINKHFKKHGIHLTCKFAILRYSLIDIIRSTILSILFPHSFTGFKNIHAPASFLKSTFENVWSEEFKLMHETSMHKFRNEKDVNQWLMLWWQVASHNFTPFKTDNKIFSANEENIDSLCSVIKNQKNDMICINDPYGTIDIINISSRIKQSFNTILHEKSSFEFF